VKTTKADLDLCPLFLDRMHRDPEIRPQVRPHFARWVSLWQVAGAAPLRRPPLGGLTNWGANWHCRISTQMADGEQNRQKIMMNPFLVLTTCPHCGQPLE
jgi:hypothetical protein